MDVARLGLSKKVRKQTLVSQNTFHVPMLMTVLVHRHHPEAGWEQ